MQEADLAPPCHNCYKATKMTNLKPFEPLILHVQKVLSHSSTISTPIENFTSTLAKKNELFDESECWSRMRDQGLDP